MPKGSSVTGQPANPMTLAPGARLGPYEIVAPIGAGGMGEVYKARDTRLDRTVAVKVLSALAADQPELRERFETEARAISSLDHPHICRLYDIGTQDGTDYLVMEYLEGQSLAERLQKGALPLDQALRYAVQIAEALDLAHHQGVTHRDLKPGNIMLTRSGSKLLDFGLARMRATQASGSWNPFSASETVSRDATVKGAILGTFQYMAPEQLEGKEVDSRADIFAFGAVLYEMVTGRKAFEGRSPAALTSAILGSEPSPISVVQTRIPLELKRAIKKCLEKNPDDRWQTARDLASELRWIAEREAQGEEVVRPRRSRLGWAAAGVFAAVSLVLGIAYIQKEPPALAPVHFLLPQPGKLAYAGLPAASGPVSVSPDGRLVACIAFGAGHRGEVTIRPLDSLSVQSLPGTDIARDPFWSPDASYVGFFAAGKLKRIPLNGGAPQTLCDVVSSAGEHVGGATWSQDGVILFGRGAYDRIYRVPAEGGLPVPVTTLNSARGETGHRWPHFLPNGHHFLYSRYSNQADNSGIYVGSLDSPDTRLLLPVPSNAVYAQGYILYVSRSALMAQPFDERRLRLTGEAFRVAEQVDFDPALGLGDFSVSHTGVLAFRTPDTVSATELTWFDRSGKVLAMVGPMAQYRTARLSPDERSIVVHKTDPLTGASGLWLLDASRRSGARITFGPKMLSFPVWSPDGSRIVFSLEHETAYDLYQKSTSTGAAEEPLLESAGFKHPTDWSRDGKFIVYDSRVPKTSWDIWILPLAGDRKPFPFVQTQYDERLGQFSPDGRWMAYAATTESNRYEVYVQNFTGEPAAGTPLSTGKWQVSTNGGFLPRWRGDGRELYYIGGDGKLMAVPVKTAGGAFQTGAPQVLFDILTPPRTAYWYSVTADGQRFLINVPGEEQRSQPVHVVLNWASGRKR